MCNLVDNRIADHLALVELTHDAIIVRDPEGRIQFWNRGAERLYGWSKKEALGAISHQLLRTSFPCAFERIQQQLSEVGHWEGELCQISRSLDAVIVSSRWVVRTGYDPRNEVAEINTDLTAPRKIEEALRHLNLELGRLVGERRRAEEEFQGERESMAAELEQAAVTNRKLMRRFRHDLRDHLGSIIGFLQLLQDGKHGELAARQRRCVEQMDVSATSLLKVIEQIVEQTPASIAQWTPAPKLSNEPVPGRGPQEQLTHE